jgi:hypothetical protein
VLAYTLLGVHWNRDTGAVRFLILDPHYTGPDVAATVIAQGWCAWKVRRGVLPPPSRPPGPLHREREGDG